MVTKSNFDYIAFLDNANLIPRLQIIEKLKPGFRGVPGLTDVLCVHLCICICLTFIGGGHEEINNTRLYRTADEL